MLSDLSSVNTAPSVRISWKRKDLGGGGARPGGWAALAVGGSKAKDEESKSNGDGRRIASCEKQFYESGSRKRLSERSEEMIWQIQCLQHDKHNYFKHGVEETYGARLIWVERLTR